jgi:hypothetical protein
MNEYSDQAHVTEWIGAYHDGELKGARLQQVAAHLEHCVTCRAELEALQGLSGLLQTAPAITPRAPARTFAAQVGLRLPHPTTMQQPAWRKALKFGWQFAPLGLIVIWAFAQAVSWVTGLVLLTGLDQRFMPNIQTSSSLDLAMGSLFHLPGEELLNVWNVIPSNINIEWLGLVYVQVLVNILLAVLLWCWLVSWWVYRKRQQGMTLRNPVE